MRWHSLMIEFNNTFQSPLAAFPLYADIEDARSGKRIGCIHGCGRVHQILRSGAAISGFILSKILTHVWA